MSAIDLYNGIYKALANDEEFLNLIGLDLSADNLTKAKRIQRRAKPQTLNAPLPMIAFYTPGGRVDEGNTLVFNSVFYFDVYTEDDVDRALRISARLLEMFHREVPEFSNIGSFETVLLNQHESAVGTDNVYCFTTVLKFSVQMTK